MTRPKRWTESAGDRGVYDVRLSAWRWFTDYVSQELLDYTSYIFRGHSASAWRLEPSLDRVVKTPRSGKRYTHLQQFKYSVRGRRGANPAVLNEDNDWWALGQHHGLHSPLLDWTESPFVALYFAVFGARAETGNSCCVWALSQGAIQSANRRIVEDSAATEVDGRKPVVEIVRPLSDENSRLVNQRGLFTRGPNNIDLETWIKQHNTSANTMDLIKITIPKLGMEECLRYLNRMNINHATLFPDLHGASSFCNTHLTTPRY